MKWNRLGADSEFTEEGYPLEAPLGGEMFTPCRFYLPSKGAVKTYKNEDSTVSEQSGTIRCDVGEIPEVGQEVEVFGHFKGIVRAVYKGQLSHRIEV